MIEKLIEEEILKEVAKLSRNKLIVRIKNNLKKRFPRAYFHSFRGPLGFYPDKKKDVFVHIDLYPGAKHASSMNSTVTMFYRFKPEGMKRKVGIRPIVDSEGNLFSRQFESDDIDTLLDEIEGYVGSFNVRKDRSLMESIVEVNDQLQKDLAHNYGHEFLSKIANNFVKVDEQPFATKTRRFNDDIVSQETNSDFWLARLDKPFKAKRQNRKHIFKRGFYIMETSETFEDRVISGEFETPEDAIQFQVQKLEEYTSVENVDIQYAPGISVNEPHDRSQGYFFDRFLTEIFSNGKKESMDVYINVVKIMSQINSPQTQREIAEKYILNLEKRGESKPEDRQQNIEQMVREAEQF